MSFHPNVHILFSISLIRIMAPAHLSISRNSQLDYFHKRWRQPKNRILRKTRLTHSGNSEFPPVQVIAPTCFLNLKWMINVFTTKESSALTKWSDFKIFPKAFHTILLNLMIFNLLLMIRFVLIRKYLLLLE